MSDTTIDPNIKAKEFMGHPKGLYVLFFTEMWERFSYYGMRGLLIFYLTQHFLFSDEKSYAIYGAYTALVYLAPVLGGALADRYLGARKAVTLGAILLVLGHIGMAIEGLPATMTVIDGVNTVVRDEFFLQVFYLSLGLIITGVGFLKANISTIVGALYEKDDPRRDSGFTIFYMGINLGSFVAALLCGYLGQTVGWWAGFGAAGVGMLLGLFVFLKWQILLEGHAEPRNPSQLKEKVFAGLSREMLIYIGAVGGVIVFWQLVQYQALVGQILGGFGAIVLAIILLYSFLKCDPVERDRMLVVSFLIFMSVIFWALFEQAGSSLNILADRNVDRDVLGVTVQASQLQSLNALFIFTLAPFFAMLWVFLAKRGWEPNTPMKFSLALVQVGLGFMVLVYGAGMVGADGKIALIWIVLLYLLHTTGELCLSPVGLSVVTKLSVVKMVGFMMGTWFLASAAANYIAGQIAKLTSAGNGTDGAEALAHTMDVYWNVGLLAIGIALALALLSPLLKKGMHGVH
ncbi:MAG: peptide MFS transporter [Alphaproteobacteria bacterium]|nr:peptide MFS transporter [Alphaproteobacteria bacterium]